MITLKSETEAGVPLEATFDPEHGMNMVSYKKGNIEAMDQSTRAEFESRSAGLGALIGPHFYKSLASEKTHGVGRYAPWQYEVKDNTIHAKLTGKDEWQGTTLEELEGQNFTMLFTPSLSPKGLHLDLSVVSDTASAVGIHYYYNLPQGTGKVKSSVQNHYYDPHVLRDIPSDWNYNGQHELVWDLENEVDYAFHPYPNPLHGDIILDTGEYAIHTKYDAPSEENAWQLYHPKGASFACVEPVSAQDPRHANLSVSSISIQIEIVSGQI